MRQLYDLLFDNVVKSIQSFNLSLEEQEDLVQESFIKIFRHLAKFDENKSTINTWSALIARGLAISHLKKKTVRTATVDLTKILAHSHNNYGDHLAYDLIMKAVNQLPEKYKQVFMLAVVEDLDHGTISRRLGISKSSSRVYLARAKEKLQLQLQGLYEKSNS